mmetsp:Transcript_24113/g.67938  ORF Transcript_24113/g.67938 Transcript_24113/m.67938 type:complete len:176 (-) Transcript_24113:41-568(-)
MPFSININKSSSRDGNQHPKPEISTTSTPAPHPFFGELDRLFDSPSSLFDRSFPTPAAAATYQSSIQMREDNEQVQVALGMPGMSNADITVHESVSSCLVDVSAGGAGNNDSKNDGNFNRQFFQQQQPQRFDFGPSVECSKLAANLSRGVLYMNVPKKAPQVDKVKTRTIHVTED